ncbi:unnamed protein product [Ambrosiozyma monospora]|uniref:Unnamed protein product n=1 Tax=Ambrosiozyma monospora TaxID=43982 RepID=A0A9W7DE98_AMBMO|nr:unnamed protein product [Ambrosiozyma monospora]
MVRVRKKTSKRVSTRMKEGIKKKASAQRRKDAKKAKKDITWRSKSKDPGIPSNFPYRDKLLMQIEEQRKEKLEEKIRKKAERKRLQQGGAIDGGDADAMDEDDEEDEGNGLAALMESAQRAAAEYNGEDVDGNGDGNGDAMQEDDPESYDVVEYELSEDDDDLEEDDENNHRNEQDKSRKQFDKIFKSVVDASDVVLYVLDARDPESTRSRRVEEAILQSQGKRLILILNKVDLVPEKVLKQWLDFLGSSFPTIPFKATSSATNGSSFNKKLTQANTATQLMLALKSYSQKSNLKRAIVVGIIGYPNVGKSSIINALTAKHKGVAHSKVCPVGNQAGVTTSLREIKVDNKLKILDSPGIVFPSVSTGGNGSNNRKTKRQQEAELALLNALPPNQIIDPVPAVTLLLKRLAKSDEMAESFKKFYGLPALPSSNLTEFTNQVLIFLARKMGRLGKGGIPNLQSAGLAVLNDWRDGKFVGYTLPKSSKSAAAAAANGGEGGEDGEKKSKIPNGASGAAPPPKVEQITVVKQWAQEFDLDKLFADVFN